MIDTIETIQAAGKALAAHYQLDNPEDKSPLASTLIQHGMKCKQEGVLLELFQGIIPEDRLEDFEYQEYLIFAAAYHYAY